MLLESVRIARVAEHSFLAAPITPDAVVIDLGVNEGAFSKGMIDAFGCSVIGVEPVPRLFSQISGHPGLTVEQAAITAQHGRVHLHINPSTCATVDDRLSQSGAVLVEVEGITLEQLLERHGLARAHLVKVDIEGAEIAMLRSATLETLARVDQFTVEFHDFLDPSMSPAVDGVRMRLRAAGFADLSLSRDNTDVLFINVSRIPFGAGRRAAAVSTQKYPMGIRRIVRRTLRVR